MFEELKQEIAIRDYYLARYNKLRNKQSEIRLIEQDKVIVELLDKITYKLCQILEMQSQVKNGSE